ncbi:hypothetical protein IC229_32710 [Spirosoma sp. BT702]|uniref:DoxX family membrane protein n=1 Tax=Spirosoma profusum TaxID=2771354 RepID=A0A927AVX1_9BACT|nr:hypothetical protein [Spirosoma profusum]MBD2705418.1 hypothetical protein [Spirosoma profusum]
MNIYLIIGRIFFGLGILGIGLLHFFYPGIRPVILPELTTISSNLSFLVYLTALLLIGTGFLITIGKKFNTLCLVMGILFLVLFLVGHLPWSLTAGSFNKYWVNTNKVLALCGEFLVISTINAPKPTDKMMQLLAKIGPIGQYLYAIMLYNFAVGHFNNLEGISNIVPKYIPFPQFWTFLGGVALMGSGISIFSRFKVKAILWLLALNLFIWLVLLHLYYTILYPQWQEGENFIGSFTCLCFCGTALVISQTASNTILTGQQ